MGPSFPLSLPPSLMLTLPSTPRNKVQNPSFLSWPHAEMPAYESIQLIHVYCIRVVSLSSKVCVHAPSDSYLQYSNSIRRAPKCLTSYTAWGVRSLCTYHLSVSALPRVKPEDTQGTMPEEAMMWLTCITNGLDTCPKKPWSGLLVSPMASQLP